MIWNYISRYAPEASIDKCPTLARLVPYAVAYYNDFVKPTQKYRAPTGTEISALNDLKAELEKMPQDTSGEDIQTVVYEIGKKYYADDLKGWFKVMYETLLGQSTGPRMGSFIALYGVKESVCLIDDALTGRLAN